MPADALQQQLQNALSSTYFLERELGRGGMATVFLACDLKHERPVAVKVLDPELGAVLGADRFLSEIRVTANLQHPNLLPLFDSGEAAGLLYYVMPYVEGETLRHRLERERQLPVDDAVRIAIAIAGALDYAHGHGVIHRDLKPENILLQHGQPVVADFGIALAVSKAGGQRVTQTGLSLGTPQYMSPEQATGDRVIDGRTDIYSLGAMLYEMLTGEPPHAGTTAQAVIARLMTEAPREITVLRPSVPMHVDAAVRRALEKLPADRFGTAKELADALRSGTYTNAATSVRGAVRSSRTQALPWVVAAVAAGIAAWALVSRPASSAAPSIRAELTVGDSASIGGMRVLPGDSLMIVNGQTAPGVRGISLVRLASGEITHLRGTEGAGQLTVSPDGRSVAFVRERQLWRIALPDGAPVALAQLKTPTCAAWGTDGRIAVCEDEGVNVTSIPAAGGPKDTLVSEGASRPQLRSVVAIGGGRFLGATSGGMWVLEGRGVRPLIAGGIVDSATARDAADAPRGTWAQQLPDGYLAWITPERTLVVAPIDEKTLRRTGPVVTIADSVVSAHFGTRGVLALMRGQSGAEGVLVIADRAGRADTLPYPSAEYRSFDVSPDGKRMAVVVANAGVSTLRLLDIGRPASRVLPVRSPHEPRWSPDGRRIAVSSGNALLVLAPDDARTIDTVYRGQFIPHSWTPDGQELAGSARIGAEYGVLLRFRPGVDTVPRRVASAGDNDWYQSFSPDGRWYAFVSSGFRPDQSGIYVAENREGATATRIAPENFHNPSWSADGRSIVVSASGGRTIGAIPVSPGPTFGTPEPIISDVRLINFAGLDVRVLRDGRVAFVQGAPPALGRRVTLLTDWRAEYARRAAPVASK